MEAVLHALGLCGENHANLISVMSEWPIISNVIAYIRTYKK